MKNFYTPIDMSSRRRLQVSAQTFSSSKLKRRWESFSCLHDTNLRLPFRCGCVEDESLRRAQQRANLLLILAML